MSEKPNTSSDSVRRANRVIRRRTKQMMVLFGVVIFLFLTGQLYWLQIIRHDELQTLAVRQQTLRTTVEASRGTIYDRSGEILAISSTAENICLSPKDIIEEKQDKDLIASGLAAILDLPTEELYKDMSNPASQYSLVREKADQETADRVRAFIKKNEIKGIFTKPTSKRYYPKGTLASHVLGFVNKSGGAYGLESVYNEALTGQNGMVVSARNAEGSALLYQYEQYFDASNGDSLITTIDSTVQFYLEKGLEELEARFGTGKGATGIVMDVNTGAVLAMASLPTYDPNVPSTVHNLDMLFSGEEGETEPSAEERSAMQLKQWRNKAVNDTYEPGSTFKTLTLAMALEEGIIDPDRYGYYCPGYIYVEGQRINCSNRNGHRQQTLIEAFANSCNPAFIDIGLRIGNRTFYDYMKAFGLTEKTGIDITGEASGFVNSEIEYSTLALGCYAFGQNFNVTPIALLNAQAACVNGGYLRRPYIVSQVLDKDGTVVYSHDTTPVRQVISEDTSSLIRQIMEYEVEKGTGKNGRVTGYRIGGKTGTADKVTGNIIVSFACFAPADDPQIIMLMTLDEPSEETGTYRSGGNMVAPVASTVMSEILPYLGIEPHYSADELVGADATVPNSVGLTVAEAKGRLAAQGFSCRMVGSGETVTDQTPLGGAIVPNSAEILLYCGAEKSSEPCVVPSIVGDSPAAANQKLTQSGLIMSASGATASGSDTVRAISQSEPPDTEVEAGTVIRVQFSDGSVLD